MVSFADVERGCLINLRIIYSFYNLELTAIILSLIKNFGRLKMFLLPKSV